MVWYEAHYLYPDPKTTREHNWKNANGWGKGGASRLMQCYRTREGGTLLSYRPCTVDESEVNAVGKLDTRRNWEKELLTTMTCLRLESLVRMWWVFSILLFDSNPSNHNSRGADWLLWHPKLRTLYTMSYEIKYTMAGLSCVHSKIQQQNDPVSWFCLQDSFWISFWSVV